MRLYCFILINMIISSLHAQSTKSVKDKVSIAIYGDYLQQNFSWSIAGNSNGQNPNVLSELKWKNVKLRGAGIDMKIDIVRGIFFSGTYHKARIYAGNATDTDYGEDNRTSPTYMAALESDKGHTYNYFAGLGYQYKIHPSIIISPYAGYSKARQFLSLTDPHESLQSGETSLNSTYQTNWTGPLVGLTANTVLKRWVSIQTRFSYAQRKYTGVADWNLIDEFAHPVSFRHQANGYQNQIDLQVNFQVVPKISLFIKGYYIHAETGAGTDQLFFNDGRTVQSRFNGAVNNTKEIGIGIRYRPFL